MPHRWFPLPLTSLSTSIHLLIHLCVNLYLPRGSELGRGCEERGLTKAADVVLPADISRILISDLISQWEEPQSGDEDFERFSPPPSSSCPIFTCLGDGYFPVYVGRDAEGKVKKITVLFMGDLKDFHHGEPLLLIAESN